MLYFKSPCKTFNYGTNVAVVPGQSKGEPIVGKFAVECAHPQVHIVATTETEEHAYWLAAMMAQFAPNVSWQHADGSMVTMPRYDEKRRTIEMTDEETILNLLFVNNLGYLPIWFVPMCCIVTYEQWITWGHRFENLIRSNIKDFVKAHPGVSERTIYKQVQECARERRVEG